jgi:propanediol utilization protein
MFLFGKDYELTEYKPLSQPGQFAANETVTLVGKKNKIENVRILGPLRPKDQVEISKTDEFFLGIDAPVRESGKTEGSPGITLLVKMAQLLLFRKVLLLPGDTYTCIQLMQPFLVCRTKMW